MPRDAPCNHPFFIENTHCWQICGVDTSLWMKSFSPIFLSLMKAAHGHRQREREKHLHQCLEDDHTHCKHFSHITRDFPLVHRPLMLRAYGLCNRSGHTLRCQQRMGTSLFVTTKQIRQFLISKVDFLPEILSILSK